MFNPLEQFIFLELWSKCPAYHGPVLGLLLLVPLILLTCLLSYSNIYECVDTADTAYLLLKNLQKYEYTHTPVYLSEVVYIYENNADNFDSSFDNLLLDKSTISQMQYIDGPTLFYKISSTLFLFIDNIILDNLLIGYIVIYTPYLYFVFNLLLFGNILGLLPFSATVTSTFIVTLYISLMSFIGINVIGLITHNVKFFKMFLPQGVPLYISPMLVIIELFSYIIRVLSITVRLFANILAGHALLKILTTSTWKCLVTGIWSIFPINIGVWFSMLPIFSLECVIAVLQAYVYILLLTVYLNDIFNLH